MPAILFDFEPMVPTGARRRQTVEYEQRTYGIAEWAAALRVPHTEQELAAVAAATREREAGQVNVRKRVRTDRERMEVPTRREEVTVERVPVSEGTATEAQIGEAEVRVPLTEEEVVVEKWPVVKEEVRVRKDVVRTPRSSRRTSGARR